MTTPNEHNNAPAVPQGWRDFLTELSKQKPEKPDYWSSCGQCERNSSTAEDLLAATPAPAPAITYDQWQQHEYTKVLQDRIKELSEKLAIYAQARAPAQGEPFGHFRPEPFGWTDCAKDDEGAIALYERPQEVGLTDEQTLKDAYQEGYYARVNYNDAEESDLETEWSKSRTKALIAARAKGQS